MSVRTTMAALVLAALSLIAAAPAVAADCSLSGPAEEGRKAAKQCQGCHVFDPAKKSRPTGPNLATVYGAKAGSLNDFKRYSEGMKLLAEKGLRWTEENLDAYIADPKPFVEDRSGRPGVMHGMFFKLADDDKREQVVAYLKALRGCHGGR